MASVSALTVRDPLLPPGTGGTLGRSFFATLAINIVALALPVMILQVYNRILPHPGTGTLGVLVVAVLVAVALEAALRLCRAYLMGRTGASYEHRTACMAMERILNADLDRLGGYGTGEYLNRMTSVGKLKDFYNGYALAVLAELALVPMFVLMVVWLAGPLAFVPAAVLVAFGAVSLVGGLRLRRALNGRSRADDRRFDFLIEALEGIHSLKAFGLERMFERRYEALEADSSVRNHEVTRELAALFNAGTIFSNVMVAAIITVGAALVVEGHLTSGALIAALLLSGRTMQPMQRALGLWVRYQDYAIARRQVAGIMETPQQTICPRAAGVVPRRDGTVVLEDVTYERDGTRLFDGVDLALRRGDAVLVSGPHGAGKSTLLELIAGVYRPRSGRILVDGVPVDTYRHRELVHHVGLVRSDALIFRGTIRDNITAFGQIDERQAREVSRLLDVDRDVAMLPAGFDTFLTGTATDSIAPGLVQRIAIARALAPKPRIILFDNADRALDRDGYATMYSMLARLKSRVSMILVSGDANIAALADREVRLDGGRPVPVDIRETSSNVRPYRELRL